MSKDIGVKRASRKTLVITCLDLVELDFTLTHQNSIWNFNKEIEFVEYISNALGIKDILFSRTPYASTMERISL